MAKDPSSNRDPRAQKARDNARQRKIATNGSDKASRKNAPRIKARANRSVRRADKQILAEHGDAFEDNADQINIEHGLKDKHWGSDNAAQHRANMAEAQKKYQAAGGRKAVQSAAWAEIRDKTDDAALTELINDQLDRLKKD